MDGFYTLVAFKIPIGEGQEYYYKNGKFYHFYFEIDLGTLLELNLNEIQLNITYDYYFQTFRLRKCYINTCYQIFDKVASINCDKTNLDKSLIYNRNLLQSVLTQ